MSGFEASLGQPDSRLEFVVVDALAPTNEKVVLLVTFTGLALDIPVVLARHFVFVFRVIFVFFAFFRIGLPFASSLVCWKEVSDELFARIVHHTTNHCLRHDFHLVFDCHASWRRIGVEYNLSAWEFPHIVVWKNRQDLDRVDSLLGVVFRDVFFGVLEGLFDGSYLGLLVHVDVLLNAHLLTNLVAHSRLDLLHCRRLEPSLFSGNVVRLPHP